jgi:hypothetical protein
MSDTAQEQQHPDPESCKHLNFTRLQVKDKSKYAVKNPEQHAVKKALRLKKRKAKEETKRAAEAAGVSPPSKKAKKAKKTTDGGLHPSWVAKKQQTVSISQEKPTGKKVIFGD